MPDHPDYDVPDNVLGGSPGHEPVTGTAEPAADEPASPPAGSPGQVGEASPDDGSGIPKYRFDEVNAALQDLREQNRMLLQQYLQLATALHRQAPAEGEAEPQLDEREQAIVGQLDRLLRYSSSWRQLQPILEHAQTLLQLAQQVPLREQQETQYWQAVAQQTHQRVLGAVAEAVLGPGKRADDLEPDRAAAIRQSFAAYVQRDPQRVARYEAQDPTLVQDFVEWFRGWATHGGRTPVDPRARQAAAAAQQRGEVIRRLPTQGPAGQPVGTAPPKVNLNDPEAVHDGAWRAFQALVNASR